MAAYKIIGFDKATGVISIQFDEKMAPIAIDVPLDENGLYITGAELDAYIQGFIPTWHLERVNKIAAGVANEAEIEALVQAPAVVDTPTPEQQTELLDATLAWQQEEAEKQIVRVLVKMGIVSAEKAL